MVVAIVRKVFLAISTLTPGEKCKHSIHAFVLQVRWRQCAHSIASERNAQAARYWLQHRIAKFGFAKHAYANKPPKIHPPATPKGEY